MGEGLKRAFAAARATQGVVSVCATCKHAEWKLTANGRRHPEGSGKCAFVFPDSPLPKWLKENSYARAGLDRPVVTSLRVLVTQRFTGRWIYWRDSHRTEPEACATWEAK